MRLTAGSRLSTYEIVAPLGAGGMGEVYRAKDVRLGRHVALKVLPETLAQDADHLARFEHEARTVAALNHPNIVTLFSVEDENHVRFLTMELVEGQSLADLITPGGLPIARVLDLGVGIADALAAAHERGVVHRDLKPANVMVNREGRVKVLDFGLAMPARGIEQDPLSTAAYHNHARVLVQAGKYLEAEGAYRKGLELTPRRAGGLANLALALSWQRRIEEAIAETMREPEEMWRLWALAIVYQVAGHTKEAETALHELTDKCAEDGARIRSPKLMRCAGRWTRRSHGSSARTLSGTAASAM